VRKLRASLRETPVGHLWRKLRRYQRLRWIRTERNPASPRHLSSVRLFAVLGTWMEEDIVGACVRNALTQGCERVYVIDNDSPDGTVQTALDAGALVPIRFATAEFDEPFRLQLMERVVTRVSESIEEEHAWWLWLDADEFSHGPAGLTIRELLERLDRRFRVVGARYFNHYPSEKPEYRRGRHPLDLQPYCEEFVEEHCAAGHRKHPLLRVDRRGPKLLAGDGYHRAISPSRLIEPELSLFIHHFPFREERVTRARFDRFCKGSGAGGGSRVTPGTAEHVTPSTNTVVRFHNVDAVYERRWADVRERRGHRLSPINPRPWPSLVGADDARVARWY
jgi:hypothetical protein